MTCTNRMITTSISQESEAARSAQSPTAAHPFRGCVGPLARHCTPTPNRLARANIPEIEPGINDGFWRLGPSRRSGALAAVPTPGGSERYIDGAKVMTVVLWMVGVAVVAIGVAGIRVWCRRIS